jgi:cellulose synthase/poly-beta-1,6-N-acetylglucosamine synthase-like glycosyltransferase
MLSTTDDTIIGVIVALNVAAVLVLAVYALYQATMLLLYGLARLRAHRMQGRVRASQASGGGSTAAPPGAPDLPVVTVQLPLYNERYVAERIIDAVCAMDYPADRLQVQVLDDSTDDTLRFAQRAVQAAQARGIDVEYVHRDQRDGFKAGALANGLRSARGELIAIFDADFIPPRDFLRRILVERRPFDDPRVGFVQTRWGYLNADSAITCGQAVMLDVHFNIDQFARSRNDMAMSFNGSGGIWRRAAIDDAGGWSADTLTEDLDLSYRAQIKGWRGVYLLDQVSPGELPESVLAFKRQQARWARGSAQCVRKLFPTIAQSKLPTRRKIAAYLHLSGYFTNLFLVVLALITPLLMLEANILRALPKWLSLCSVVTLSPLASMFVAQWAQKRPGMFLRGLPAAIMLGIGISFSNGVAVLVGLFGRQSGEFVRTPKSAAQPPEPRPSGQGTAAAGEAGLSSLARRRKLVMMSRYALKPDWTVRIELALGVYTLGVCILLALRGEWFSAFPLLVYVYGFMGVSLIQLTSSSWITPRNEARPGNVESSAPFVK